MNRRRLSFVVLVTVLGIFGCASSDLSSSSIRSSLQFKHVSKFFPDDGQKNARFLTGGAFAGDSTSLNRASVLVENRLSRVANDVRRNQEMIELLIQPYWISSLNLSKDGPTLTLIDDGQAWAHLSSNSNISLGIATIRGLMLGTLYELAIQSEHNSDFEMPNYSEFDTQDPEFREKAENDFGIVLAIVEHGRFQNNLETALGVLSGGWEAAFSWDDLEDVYREIVLPGGEIPASVWWSISPQIDLFDAYYGEAEEFLLAHELGHFFLDLSELNSCAGRLQQELEADVFAIAEYVSRVDLSMAVVGRVEHKIGVWTVTQSGFTDTEDNSLGKFLFNNGSPIETPPYTYLFRYVFSEAGMNGASGEAGCEYPTSEARIARADQIASEMLGRRLNAVRALREYQSEYPSNSIRVRTNGRLSKEEREAIYAQYEMIESCNSTKWRRRFARSQSADGWTDYTTIWIDCGRDVPDETMFSQEDLELLTSKHWKQFSDGYENRFPATFTQIRRDEW